MTTPTETAEASAGPASESREWVDQEWVAAEWVEGGAAAGAGIPEQHADGKKILERISKETGGRLFQVSKKEPVNQIYTQIQEELRNQYSLGYTPNPAEPGYHKIVLAASKKDLMVQARDGYYGDK